MWRLVLTVSLLCCRGLTQDLVTCRDKDDNPVDWFILYKTPQINQKNKNLDGLGYVYIDPNTATAQPNDNNKKINSPNGVLAHTLDPLFKFDKNNPRPNFGFISYSDQPPFDPKASDSYGHSKGVVMVKTDGTDNNGQPTGTGVWLLHSTPKFPNDKNSNNFWPSTGATKAQTFICVTFNYDEFNKIGKHLQRIKAYPFDAHIPPGFHEELKQAANKENNNIPNDQIQELKSREGKEFRSIAKQVSTGGKPEDGDLYVTISEEIDSDVDVQTWGGQTEKDKSYCSQNNRKVQNVESVKMGRDKWQRGSDHSKWCVAVNKPWTCIADVNRSGSQYKRRGGALCIHDDEVRNIFKGFVDDVEKCEIPSQSTKRGPPRDRSGLDPGPKKNKPKNIKTR